MLIPRYLVERGVPGIACPVAYGFTVDIRAAAKPRMHGCLAMPRFSCSLGQYLRQHAKAGTACPSPRLCW